MKVVMTQALCPEGYALLGEDAEIYVANDPDPNRYLDRMAEADALIVRVASCDANVIEHSPNLKVIGRTGVGYDTVDVRKATEKGIPVVITPGANSRSVAEHAAAMLFALAKDLPRQQSEMLRGNWEIRSAGGIFELEGRRLGVIGMGAIGREITKIAHGIGMRVTGYDPFLSAEKITALGADPCADYREMLRASDAVTIHVPLTDETRDMITKREIDTMKPGAILINCSRSGIVNEEDLFRALEEGRLGGAGLDVFAMEPLKETPGSEERSERVRAYLERMKSVPRLIVTPHTAAQTGEAVVRMHTMCAEGCMAVCRGEKWPYVADKTVYEHPKWRAMGEKD